MATIHGMQDLWSSTRYWTLTPCSESLESQPLIHHGSLKSMVFKWRHTYLCVHEPVFSGTHTGSTNVYVKVQIVPQWLSGKESACQCRRHKFNPWVRKIPWRRKWQPTPTFLPGKFHGPRSLATVHGIAKSWTWLSNLGFQGKKCMGRWSWDIC